MTGDFLVGLNKPCFGGQYDHDLGNNQFSKWQPYLPNNFDTVGSFFSQVHDVDLVRIWLFEGLEGLIFDDNNELVSIERTFLESLKKILDLAAQSNIRVYLCLFDAWAAKHRPATLDPMELAIHGTRFISNTLTKLCEFLSDHAATIFAIDLMNEPEGLIEYNITTWNELESTLNKWCNYLHNNHDFKCSVGWMRRKNAAKYSYLDVDFCDFHIYNESGEIPYYDRNDF